ncbi:Retrovirus-related Pol polyprotein from transposon RE2-like protein [Drosera capensis]
MVRMKTSKSTSSRTNQLKPIMIHHKIKLELMEKQRLGSYSQEEGIDYEETFAPLATFKAIRMLIAFAALINFMLYQMDVKSAFLNGYLKRNVYVEEPPGFYDLTYLDHVFNWTKLSMALNTPQVLGIKSSLNSCCHMGQVDKTLFIKNHGKSNLLIVQIYVDDIKFGATNEILCKEFFELMKGEFEISMMGELIFFLGVQIKQGNEGTIIHQQKYLKKLLKKFGMTDSKTFDTPIPTSCKLDADPQCRAKKQKGIWYMDSGCSGHMIGNKSILEDYIKGQGPLVIFGGGKAETFIRDANVFDEECACNDQTAKDVINTINKEESSAHNDTTVEGEEQPQQQLKTYEQGKGKWIKAHTQDDIIGDKNANV